MNTMQLATVDAIESAVKTRGFYRLGMVDSRGTADVIDEVKRRGIAVRGASKYSGRTTFQFAMDRSTAR
jgi:hypothetical protein